jgi:hypothetical protein
MLGEYTLRLEMGHKVEIGQAVYSLPDGSFYTIDKSKIKGMPLGYVGAIDGKNIDVIVQTGTYRLTLPHEVNPQPHQIIRKNRYEILKET